MYEAWKRLPLSFSEWQALPGLEWMRLTLPWQVERAEVVSGYMLNMGGRDSLVEDAQWFLTVDCPWRLCGQDGSVSWEDDDSEMAKVVDCLPGTSVLEVQAASVNGDEPVFTLSNGWWLEVSPFSDLHPASDPYVIQVWGTTFVYNRGNDEMIGSGR